MRTARSVVGILVLGIAVSAQAAVIDVGVHRAPGLDTTFDIPILITGAEAVTDMVATIQIADGGSDVGGTTDGPEIVGVSLTDPASIWTMAPGGYTLFFGAPPGTVRQVVDPSVSLNVPGQNVFADGILLTITVDVTGFAAGDEFDLLLTGTVGLDTALKNGSSVVPLTVNNGTIIVPEPATMMLLSSGLLLLLRRRRRRK